MPLPYLPRIATVPKETFFLFGPRGCGKTTWVRNALSAAALIDLRDERLFHRLVSQPGLFAQMLANRPRGSWVLVDEFQRYPELLHEVHRAIDERGLRFALTGSSARKLRRAGVNLLGGRARRRSLYPFVPEELGERFELEKALRLGTLPVVLAAKDPNDALQAYVDTYLKEEIQAEALVRNLPAFARFLPVAALFHGQVVNVSNIARDAGVARNTVEDHLAILEDTNLAFRVPGLEADVRVRERVHPKLYWIDPGVVRAMKGNTGALAAEERGPLLEGLVAMMLKAYCEYRAAFDRVSCWAPRQGKLEVDFVLSKGAKHVALEVKASNRFRTEELGGLEAIAELKGVVRRLYVYTGEDRLKHPSGVEALPFAAFTRELENGTLFRNT